jgi:imidazolonepropionase
MRIFRHLSEIVTLEGALKKDGRHLLADDLGIIKNAAIVVEAGLIAWVGKDSDLPTEFKNGVELDCHDHILLPEFCDSHTHTLFGGDRSDEYMLRLNGADYQKIADAGGGILSTVRATCATSTEALYESTKNRLLAMSKLGVGFVEIKTGYGLSLEEEIRLIEIIESLKCEATSRIPRIFSTFMPAHAVPMGKTKREYMEEVVLPSLSNSKADAVDIFHEKGYFDTTDTIALFERAKKRGMKLKIHADEFNDNGGAALAAQYGALSADHLLATSDDGIRVLAASSTVATLLPGTAFFLGKPLARARAFLDAGAKVAIASDYNPGSCHYPDLFHIAKMAAPSLKMNAAELIAAITLNAKHALGIQNEGALVKGQAARMGLFKSNSLAELLYSWGENRCERLIGPEDL